MQPPNQANESGLATWLDSDKALVGGVAYRLSAALGMHRSLVRVTFAVLSLAAGVGIALYALGWVLMWQRPQPEPRPRLLRNDLALVLMAAAVLSAVTASVDALPDPLLWLVSSAILGLAVAGTAQLHGDLAATDRSRELLFGASRLRIVIGVALVLAAVATALAATQSLTQLWQSLTAIVVLLVGIGFVLGPWLLQVSATAETERLERIRAEERADIAAHLHDSVLQTLTLIQNRAAEPQVTAALAHQQERELRRWLYGTAQPHPDAAATLRSSIEHVGAEVEDQYLVAVDVIVVGDHPLDPVMQALVAATREALVNAAKFSQTQLISVFAEVTRSTASVSVRDRGIGFNLAQVPADRKGITDSIVGRLNRLGGEATIRTDPAKGTEVLMVVRIDHSPAIVDEATGEA